ncbi:hypothetical protein [Sandarakinorhabdus glacialis]|uniref:hypothetical protein n=1 Tax=Sandarakinorhabdus glacialis TaxID=1614636 RepID=UPI001665382D|nr:hypothetical protein [Polymorphobacter glacialis]
MIDADPAPIFDRHYGGFAIPNRSGDADGEFSREPRHYLFSGFLFRRGIGVARREKTPNVFWTSGITTMDQKAVERHLCDSRRICEYMQFGESSRCRVRVSNGMIAIFQALLGSERANCSRC